MFEPGQVIAEAKGMEALELRETMHMSPIQGLVFLLTGLILVIAVGAAVTTIL